MLFRSLLFLAFIVIFTGTENRLASFAGKWKFDEARSSYNLTTKVIKDLPAHLKVKIPGSDSTRLFGVPRYFIKPPIVVIKIVGRRLTTSAPPWFQGWIPFEAELPVDGKQREKKFGGGVYRFTSRWEEGKVIREWSDNAASVYESSEGRDVFSLSEDGKTLTVERRSIHKLRTDVDDQPYELDDVEEIRSVFVKIR